MKRADEWVRQAMLGLLLAAGSAARAASDDTSQAQDAAHAQAQRRQQMIEQCMRNRGSEEDCAQQADTELGAEDMPRQHSDGERRRGPGR